MTTWSGQPDELALHWGPETYQRLGHVVELLRTGRAADRDQAYEEFIELKRWFILEEFNLYLNDLDQFRSYRGVETISEIMDKIHTERKPATDWKALQGPAIEPVMLPEMESTSPFYQKQDFQVVKEVYTIDPCDAGKCDVHRCINSDKYEEDGVFRHKEHFATDYYSLFIKIIRRCK